MTGTTTDTATAPQPVTYDGLFGAVVAHECQPLCDRTTHAQAVWMPDLDPATMTGVQWIAECAGVRTFAVIDLAPHRRELGYQQGPPSTVPILVRWAR